MSQTAVMLLGVLTAALVVLCIGRPVIRLSWRIGLLDQPRLRGVHAEAVARSGGLMILAGLLTGMAVIWLAAGEAPAHLALLAPLAVVVALGFVDDLRPLGAPLKLCVQIGAAALAWAVGFRLEALALPGVDVGLQVLSLPLTVLFLVGVTNAFNMVDGVNGLCAGFGVVALAGLCLLSGGPEWAFALPLLAATAAFLRFNLWRPRAFLGDAGSTALGFAVAALTLKALVSPTGALNPLSVLLLLSLPLVDLLVSVVRRLASGMNPFEADRGHIHHVAMLLFGGRPVVVVAVLLGASGCGVLGALLLQESQIAAGAFGAVCLVTFAAVYAAGGYFSPRNLLRVARISHLAGNFDQSLCEEQVSRLLEITGLDALALEDSRGVVCWARGQTGIGASCLRVPLYEGSALRGTLLLTGRKSPGAMAFTAQLLLPIYPALASVLADTAAPLRVAA
jgi:UDP-GlcNAc:undecaprenyl-phosphate/decaprenyl-phosphate GlcNAc-1-phosphate transferase